LHNCSKMRLTLRLTASTWRLVISNAPCRTSPSSPNCAPARSVSGYPRDHLLLDGLVVFVEDLRAVIPLHHRDPDIVVDRVVSSRWRCGNLCGLGEGIVGGLRRKVFFLPLCTASRALPWKRPLSPRCHCERSEAIPLARS
jgi:hypothetical protein